VATKYIELECIHCHSRIPLDKNVAGCPTCGENILEARYDLAGLDVERWLEDLPRRKPNLWRYHEVLPIADTANIVTMGEGHTPLIKSRALAAKLGLDNLYIKDERQGPTGSFKDRQATVAISALHELGVKELVVASTGNVAIAYSAYCARAGIKLWAFFPSLTPNDKMREVALYGTEVIRTTGTYDQTKELAAKFAAAKGVFLDRGIKSIAAIEGMKAMAYEIAEQLGMEFADGQRWIAPDWFLQAVSGGMGPIGVGKGFREMYNFGLIDHMPAMGVIQAAGCAPMVEAFERGQRVATPIENPSTIITTLATGNPGRAYELLFDYVHEYGGQFVSASDEEAFAAIRMAARSDGLSVEPATGVTFAGLMKLVDRGLIRKSDIVVLNCSGHTVAVEKTILGEQWQRLVDLSDKYRKPVLPEEGIVSAVEQMDAQIKKVLVIEDNEEAARLITRVLKGHHPCEVYHALNGGEGLKMVYEIKPDMVITDLMMPEVDGFTVIDRLKADEKTAQIPIVVLSAKELTVKERERLQGRVDMLLQKGSALDDEFIEGLVNKLKQ
jgi:threonine synthase